ncbi:hypothetical protein Q3G72_018476 [Acer saccharum]|nr:hypothetical protein Q3G72_018476 [Acer saccharum]
MFQTPGYSVGFDPKWRNQVVHNKAATGVSEVLGWSESFIEDFRQASFCGGTGVCRSPEKLRWKAPDRGFFKINTDAAIDTAGGRSGLGVIIRDCKGLVMASACYGISASLQPQIAEAMAIFRGILLAFSSGLLPALLESDALSVVNEINAKEPSFADVGVVVSDILGVLGGVRVLSVNFAPRDVNVVAHGLAKLALSYVGEWVWLEDCPLCVESLVLGDSLIAL